MFPPFARRDAERFLAQARVALAEERYDDAIGLYRSALRAAREGWGRRHRQVIEPLTGLAVSLKLEKRFREAEPVYAEALHDVDRGFADEQGWLAVHLDAAGVYWSLGKMRTAIHLYERLEDRAATGSALEVSAHFHRALGHRWLYEMEIARGLARELPSTGGWPVTRKLLVGRTYALGGDHERAAEEYRSAQSLLEPGATYREAVFGSRTSPVPVVIASRLAVELHRLGDPDATRHAETVERGMAELGEKARAEALETIAFDRGELCDDPSSALVHHRQAREAREERWGSSAPATTESRVRCIELGVDDDDRDALATRLDRELGLRHAFVERLRTASRQSPLLA